MKNEIITTIISAIVGAISGGIVTWLLDLRKERRENKKQSRKNRKEIFENRPEFDIVDYKDYISRTGYGVKQECDLNIFLARIEGVSVDEGIVRAQFEMNDFNTDEWCCAIYTFKNVGKTDVTCVWPISVHKKRVVLYDTRIAKKLAEEGVLSYSVCYDKKIRVGETFILKICYHKDCVIAGTFEATLDLGFEDSNCHFWLQPFFAPEDKVYDSRQVTHKEYREQLLPDKAIECFKKPWLW